jgi:Arc/MetJ-type ribon-helix-helix transcriptional regulator
MRSTKTISISLAPKQFKTAERLAKKQSRTMSELFREGLRRLEQEEELKLSRAAAADLATAIRLIQQSAKTAGLDKMTKREINAEIEAARRTRAAKTRRSTKRPGR